ncbi:MAG: UDP-N-acetylglucosamine 1-carboxyvinyltransferase [Candidatus Babeliaceae bacterium]|nr:UDP-N-acetylglucosamine 1-carboxyvinyltransferase [Candidatus Babeliaceae bacterium]
MHSEFLVLEKSPALCGISDLNGAKNAVLVIMASLILTSGKSKLCNVPFSHDVFQMIALLESLGAGVVIHEESQSLTIDTTTIIKHAVNAEIMKKMRASILVMGPLLARFGKAAIALPGGCLIGDRPVDMHLNAFARMGAEISLDGSCVYAQAVHLKAQKFILAYPSVGATENIMMAATLIQGKTTIVNAALEPEVFDLAAILKKMGAHIDLLPAGVIEIVGVPELKPVTHTIIMDRLEAGTLLLATAVTGGEIALPQGPGHSLEVFLEKLCEMGHSVDTGIDGIGIYFKATKSPKAVSFKTMPYPGFPTDLQAPMMVAQCLADGTSTVTETVFENRMLHVRELQKMGAHIELEGMIAKIKGVDRLYGAHLIAPDIRASAALVIAGIAAHGSSTLSGIHHLLRGYQNLCGTLQKLGARIIYKSEAI